MEEKFNRKETWEKSHGGAPVKCVLDVGKNLRYFFDQTMAINGLTSIQTRVLGHIYVEELRGNYVFQRDIEEIFRIKRSSVTSVLQTLEKKGIVYRENVPGDARIKRLVLTDAAREIHKSTYAALDHMEQSIRSLFTEEEFRTFLDYMDRIDRKAIEIYYSKEETND
ncbi:MAG: winged helix-turn-helix transcriptional regulator [Lachnospiraceae bacterium]|nr:winged helix-turn-helix transcriptional regulator [Lachnospiraceae bacterium]